MELDVARRRPATRTPASSRASHSWWRQPWLVLLAVTIGARGVTVLLLAAAHAAVAAGLLSSPHEWANQDFAAFLRLWDGHAYRQIATEGYPDHLWYDDHGAVEQNVWAFLPLYPALVRLLQTATALPFDVVAPTLSVLCSTGAVLALHATLRPTVGRRRAMRGAVLFALTPLGFVFTTVYAEGLFLLLVFTSTALLVRGRFLTMIPFAVLAASTRPGALLLPAALAVVLVTDLASRRATVVRCARLVVAGLVTAAAGLAWPFVVAAAVGVPDGYVQTELAWWRDLVGDVDFVPLTPWPLMAWTVGGVVGVLVLAVLVVVAGSGLVRWARTVPVVLWAPVLAYGLYVFAVFLPQESVFRLLLPMAALLSASVLTGSAQRFRVAVVVSLALQPVAIVLLWVVFPP